MNIHEVLRKTSHENVCRRDERFIGGLKGSAAALLLASLDEPVLVVAPDEHQAEILKNDILVYRQFFSSDSVEVLPYPDEPHLIGEQARVLHLQSQIRTIVSYPEAVLCRIGNSGENGPRFLHIRKGASVEREDLAGSLRRLGYRELSVVAQQGEFSVRNWIIDVFPTTEDQPVRIEFFGDEIESVRDFHIDTQRSSGMRDDIFLYPATGPGAGEGEIPLIDIAGRTRKLFDIDGALTARRDDLDITTLSFVSGGGIEDRFLSFGGTGILQSERKSVEEIADVLDGRSETIVIMMPHEYQAKRMSELFGKRGMHVPVLAMGETAAYPGRIAVAVGSLSEGIFVRGLMILTQKELFGKSIVLVKRVSGEGERFLDRFEDIAAGDFVVHDEHGIGRFRGLARHQWDGAAVEVALVEYADNALLYVPLYHIDRLHKFRAEEGFVPSLDRMGGRTWNRKKSKARKKIDLIVARLVELYAEREVTKGYAVAPDSEVHREFYSFFPYQETEDQMRAIRDISTDMESEIPMDRLLCGDVGFGKTEVAMRASFKAVYDGRQVAVIVPTTILCEQHFLNFQERFAAFPVVIDFISRFKTGGQIRDTLERIRKGEIDIIIGTTALLRRQIDFPNLGLLVIDEEHRFGVAQKEKIKELRKGIDCLMLSATPIPRTLQMALSGIRTMSIIETPPEERLAVRTVVGRFEEQVIREAVSREIARGGQVFFVHNRIGDIDKLKEFLRKLFPDLKIVSAHGQMKAKELEDIMIGFMKHEHDILLCTNIIASGIDIPTANTIIVDRADRFGLADLYQLKGRVGRGSVRAYAYFMVDVARGMTEPGKRRLKAIEQLSYLGAGLKLAMKDLEIRGAGTLFGYEQSGHIHEVGFDLYLDMMKKEVERLRGTPVEEEHEPEIEIPVDALIPDTYVGNEAIRLSLYRRMAGIRDEVQLADLRAEMEDRFGRIPPETARLLDIVSLRALARRLHVGRLSMGGSVLTVSFRDDTRISLEKMFALTESRAGIQFREKGFSLSLGEQEFSRGLDSLGEILRAIEG
ncbi:MAG: transcription-repair coupling factor [bacterium]